MKKSEQKPESKPRARKDAAAARPVRRGAKLASSPPVTVNDVMQWLRKKLGVYLPILPLSGWPSILQSLWELVVPTPFPSGPLPWTFQIEGSWPAIFPQVGSPPVLLENLTIHVLHKSWTSPG